MAKSLLERLALDRRPTGRIADSKRDLAEAVSERAEIDGRIADAERRSEDPATPHDEAELAHRQVADLRFYAKRLDRAITDVRNAIAAKEADAGHHARLKEFDDAKAARDGLTERWQALAPVWGTLVDLFAETAANDTLLAQVNRYRPGGADPLRSAEIEGRGALNEAWWPNSIGQAGEPFQRLVAVDWPHLDRPGFAWSQREAERRAIAAQADSDGARSATVAAAREAASTPEAIAAKAKAEAARFKRFLVSQGRYCGTMLKGIRHRDGVSGVDSEPVGLWMVPEQVRAAEKRGLKLELAPLKEKTRQDGGDFLPTLGRERAESGNTLQVSHP